MKTFINHLVYPEIMTRIMKPATAVNNGFGGIKLNVPKEIQVRLGIRPGDILIVELGEDGFFVRKEGGN